MVKMQGMNEVERARLRAEYDQLQREYRNMEATRKAYAEESLSVIKKQKESIEKLQKVNDALKTELDTELRYANRRVVLPGSAVSALHDQLDLFMGKVELEKKSIEEMQQKIEETKATVVKESRAMGGVNAAKEAERLLERQVKVLDNRLEKALVRFNEALAANKDMRATIDALRQERTVFETVYRKLERELAERKRGMAGLIETANQAYAGRDVAQMEAAKIMQEANAERLAFEAQLAAVDNETDAELAAARAAQDDMRGSLTMEEEEDLKQSLKDHQSELASLVAQARAHATRVEQYELAFNAIREESGIDDVEELVAVFSRNEDANFALFSFVSQQQGEMSKLEEQMDKLKAQALSFEAGRKLLGEGGKSSAPTPAPKPAAPAAGSGVAAARAAAAAAGTAGDAASGSKRAGGVAGKFASNPQLIMLTGQIERLETRLAASKANVETVRSAVDDVLHATCADRQAGAALALTDGAVTEGNLLNVLALLEQRTQAIISAFAGWERTIKAAQEAAGHYAPDDAPSPERAAALTMLGAGPTSKPGAAEARLRPPVPAVSDFNLEDEAEEERAGARSGGDATSGLQVAVEEDDEAVARPLPLDEIKRQALGRLQPLGLVPAGSGR